MLDQFRVALSEILTGPPGPPPLELHAGLHRLCQANAQRLRNLLRENAWEQRLVEIEQGLGPALEQPVWVAYLARRFRWGNQDQALVFCAALLQALDAYHKRHRSEMVAPIVEIPAALGGGRTLFLRPPSNPIEELVPTNRKLGRGAADLKNDVHHILGLWWQLIPLEDKEVQPQLSPLPATASDELGRRLRQGDLRIGICSPFAGLGYVIRTDPARCHAGLGVPYRFAEIDSASLEPGRKILAEVLDLCARERIDLLCFPELTLDTSLLRDLSNLLKVRNDTLHPALVMAGSFHVDAGTGRANRCSLLDGFGDLLLTQDKCTAYSLPGSQVVSMKPEHRLGLDERGGYEDIEVSGTVHIVESPLGRIAMPICLDFCGEQLRELFIETRVNLFLVPAMTPQVDPFYIRARELGTLNRASTLMINSSWLLQRIGPWSPRQQSFAYFPAKNGLLEGGSRISDSLSVFTIREVLGLP
jgi:hypothetical protein